MLRCDSLQCRGPGSSSVGFLVKPRTLALSRQWYVVGRFKTGLLLVISGLCLSLLLLSRRGVTPRRSNVGSFSGCLLCSSPSLLRFRLRGRTLSSVLDSFGGRRLLGLSSSTASCDRGDNRLGFFGLFYFPLFDWAFRVGFFRYFLFLRRT
jgi:hypothetical protein